MDPHPLSARGVAALALALAGCGDNVTPEVAQPTVEVAALPGVSSKDIDVVIVVATADPARFAAAVPAVLGPLCKATGAPAFRIAVLGADGAPAMPAEPVIYQAYACDDFSRVTSAIAAAAPASGGALIDALRGGFAMTGFRRPDADVLELIAADSDDASAGDVAGLEGGVQPTCFATEQRGGDSIDLPECPHDGDCFAVIHDDYACPHVPDYLRVSVSFAAAPTATTFARVRCELP